MIKADSYCPGRPPVPPAFESRRLLGGGGRCWAAAPPRFWREGDLERKSRQRQTSYFFFFSFGMRKAPYSGYWDDLGGFLMWEELVELTGIRRRKKEKYVVLNCSSFLCKKKNHIYWKGLKFTCSNFFFFLAKRQMSYHAYFAWEKKTFEWPIGCFFLFLLQ